MKGFNRNIVTVGLLMLLVGSCTDMGEPEIFLPDLVLDMNEVDFSSNTIGNLQTRVVHIINHGVGELNGVIELIQTDSVFAISQSGSFEILPDDTLPLQVNFNPTDEISYSASILILSNDPDQAEVTVVLDGVGTAALVPILTLSNTHLDFGTIQSSENATRSLTLYSTGTDTLIISDLQIDLVVFQADLSFPSVILPGDSQIVNLTFTPETEGSFQGEMTIISNSSSSPQSVSLNGIAEDLISYSLTVQPVWDDNCTGCHGGSGGLFLGSYDLLMAGGSSGASVIPGNGTGSRVIERLRGTSGSRMPMGGAAIDAETIDLIETWIDQGALNN